MSSGEIRKPKPFFIFDIELQQNGVTYLKYCITLSPTVLLDHHICTIL